MKWHPIESIPVDRHVIVKSVTGVVCRAKVSGRHRLYVENKKHPTVHCWRRDQDVPSGDIMAIAWREED